MTRRPMTLGRGGGGGGRGGRGGGRSSRANQVAEEKLRQQWEQSAAEDAREDEEDDTLEGAEAAGAPSTPVSAGSASSLGFLPVLGARMAGGVAYRDYAFPERGGGQYVYRQFENGSILIVESPKGPYEKGYEPPELTSASNFKAWRAITNAIQAQKAGKRADTIAQFAMIAAATAIVVTALVPPPRRGGGRKRRKERFEEPPPREPMSVPWVGLGIGAALIVGLLAVFNRG